MITNKQRARVDKIIECLGKDYVTRYIRYFYKDADINNLRKEEAQKIITGLDHKIPRKTIGVYTDNQYVV